MGLAACSAHSRCPSTLGSETPRLARRALPNDLTRDRESVHGPRVVDRRSRVTAGGSCSRVARPTARGRPSIAPTAPRARRSSCRTFPTTLRSGDTITPVISSDGCVVVVQTQLALDLFRDDNNDERWDVYRLVVPECGGQFDAWELVSASGRTGTARDDVVVETRRPCQAAVPSWRSPIRPRAHPTASPRSRSSI